MALQTGLLPVLAFVLTVGVAILVTIGAHLLHRGGGRPFDDALRSALLVTGCLYLVGVAAVWAVAGGWELWEVAATLLIAGAAALLVLTVLPLLVGWWLVRHERGVDSETALRFATYGWFLAMLVVFGIFVAPSGFAGGDLLDLGGERVCLVGFCGIVVRLLAAVLLELVVAVLGPGVVGVALHSAVARTGDPGTSSGV